MTTTEKSFRFAVIDGWEYWLLAGTDDVFRVRFGNRGYMLPEGIPANARWEESYFHFVATKGIPNLDLLPA